MKYKVGDRVKIKSLDWYNKNKDEFGNIDINEDFTFYADRSRYCGKVFTISEVFDNSYLVKEDNNEYYWADDMIECLVGEEMKSEDGLLDEYEELTDRAFKGGYEKCKSDIELNGFQLPEGYRFVDENGNVINATKIVLEKKKKKYPKTYKECCRIIGFCSDVLRWDNPFRINRDTLSYIKHLDNLMESFCRLLVCRDAYWKIAGEEMELGKPWELSIGIPIYYIYYNRTLSTIKKDYADDIQGNVILAFPTEEMRDAFYENFKEIINECKELL